MGSRALLAAAPRRLSARPAVTARWVAAVQARRGRAAVARAPEMARQPRARAAAPAARSRR
ncbi:MAG TPA: hypothetical protein VMU85_02895 [Stellaceae bacterium]|nr:hypothetical protein [Stellaceae bacterium]